MTDRRGFRVTGRVQGVGFRWWTRATAQSLGLSGTVRNARDGSVEVQAAGPREALDRFERLLRQGPRGAHVETLERTEPGEEPCPAGFSIVH